MKLLLAQPSVLRFRWELEVLLTNLKQFGDFDIVLLFTQHDDTIPPLLEKKYGVSCFVYPDERPAPDRKYLPSVRPFLLWQYLKQDPARELEQYFYIDADIIFRQWPDFATFPNDPSKVYGADVSGYLDANYVAKCQDGPTILAEMAKICGTTVEAMQGVPGIGAQLVLNQPKAEFWKRSYDDCAKIFTYLQFKNTNLQKWTAEMWSQQWGWVREGIEVVASPELAFSRPTDTIDKWDQFNIMHNAGVLESGPMFFKGIYTDRMPFGEDFSKIDPNKVSSKYVEAIEKVVL